MKKILLVLYLFIFGCYQIPNVFNLNQHIPVESSFMVTGNKFEILGTVRVTHMEPVILSMAIPSWTDMSGLYNNAFNKLKSQAYGAYGRNVGLINIAMDV